MEAPSTSAMDAAPPHIQRGAPGGLDVLSPPRATSWMLKAKMLLFRSVLLVLFSWLAVQASGLALGRSPRAISVPSKKALLQDLVTWDNHSLFVRGERILFYSGEFHPFRLPVPGLWLDVFQKIKALGYSGVSFYVDWALVEGTPGVFSAEGIFDLNPFFAAASEAGIYLLARPGPYINAEVSGGGFPGWLQRIKGHLRTPDPDYLNATNLYVQSIGQIIAKAQITNGGPVILPQPENEYTQAAPGIKFPNGDYFAYVEQQYRNAGIVLPFISNGAAPKGIFAPGNGTGSVDIYGHDGYPLGLIVQIRTPGLMDRFPLTTISFISKKLRLALMLLSSSKVALSIHGAARALESARLCSIRNLNGSSKRTISVSVLPSSTST